MKKLLLTAAFGLSMMSAGAYADGLPDYNAAPAPVEPVCCKVNWDGIYVGGGIGIRAVQTDHDYSYQSYGTPASESYKSDEFIGFVTVGFDKQVRPGFIVGVFADFEFGKNSFDGTTTGGLSQFSGQPFSGSFDNVWAAGLRAGFVHDDRLFWYVSGGYTQADFKYSVTGSQGFDDTIAGWFVGAGVDYLIRDNWFLNLQYRYTNFEDAIAQIGQVCNCNQNDRFQTDTHTFRVGVTYKFGERREEYQPLK